MSREQQITAAAKAMARYFGDLDSEDAAQAMIEAYDEVFGNALDKEDNSEAYDAGLEVLYEFSRPEEDAEDEE